MPRLDPDIEDLDLYEVLGVPPSADERMIETAFRTRYFGVRPDRNLDANSTRQGVLLLKARETLRDPALRAQYDAVRAQRPMSTPAAKGASAGPPPPGAAAADAMWQAYFAQRSTDPERRAWASVPPPYRSAALMMLMAVEIFRVWSQR